MRSTKRCLKKMIGRAHFSLDELTTALAEIEAVLNLRPLSYVSGEDREEPINPSHLVIGRRLLSLPDNLDYVCDLDDEEFTIDATQANRRIKHLNNILNHFWKRWQTEYLSCLREVHANSSRKHKNKGDCPIAVGEIVIVRDDHLPQGQWSLGRVQDVLKGGDGLTRAATVKIASVDQRHSVLRRPVQLLYPLEIGCNSTPALHPIKKSLNLSQSTLLLREPDQSELPPRKLMKSDKNGWLNWKELIEYCYMETTDIMHSPIIL